MLAAVVVVARAQNRPKGAAGGPGAFLGALVAGLGRLDGKIALQGRFHGLLQRIGLLGERGRRKKEKEQAKGLNCNGKKTERRGEGKAGRHGRG